MPAKTLTNMTAEELATELARKQAEQAAEAAAEQAAREERQAAHDRELVAAYDATEAAMKAEEDAAYEEFRAALLTDPVFSAWIRYRAGRWRRTYLRSDVVAAMDRTGHDGPKPTDLAYRDPRLLEDALQFCEDEARRLAADDAERRQSARDAAGGA